MIYDNWSFRTQVISYHYGHFTHFYFQFGHFIPSLVISYPVWSFRTYFYYFLENCFGHFVPIFYCFVPKSFRTRSHFVPILVISYPGHFEPTSKLGTNWLGYEMTFFFVVIRFFETRYKMTLVWNDFLFCCSCVWWKCVWFARCQVEKKNNHLIGLTFIWKKERCITVYRNVHQSIYYLHQNIHRNIHNVHKHIQLCVCGKLQVLHLSNSDVSPEDIFWHEVFI